MNLKIAMLGIAFPCLCTHRVSCLCESVDEASDHLADESLFHSLCTHGFFCLCGSVDEVLKLVLW